MAFHNQNEFRGCYISDTVDHPIMHKKGKRWIVISLSALMLLGLGKVESSNMHVHADTTQIQSAQVIQNKAAQLNRKLLVTAPKTDSTALGTNKQSSTKPASVGTNTSSSPVPSTESEDTDPDADQKYNFDASDGMYDTPKNDYLNNVNNLVNDVNGQSIRAQIRLTYGFNQADPSQPLNNVSAPAIDSNVIQDLNNSNIGILPLYCQGNSIRKDGTMYPRDTALYYLNDNERPNDSVGYQKMIPESTLIGYLLTAPRNTDFTPFFNKYFYLKTDDGMALDTNNSEMSTTDNQDTSNPNHVLFPNVPNTGNGVANYDGDTIDLEYLAKQTKPNIVRYMYNGQQVGEWTSPNKGYSDDIDNDFVNFYNDIQSTDAPGLPSKYFIPTGSTIDHPEYNSDNNPLEDFFSIYPADNDETCFKYGHDYTINVDVPYTQLHLKYFENDKPADLPEQTVYGPKGSAINVSLVNKINVPTGYHLQNINTNHNQVFTDNSQEIDVDLAADKTNTIVKKVPVPNPAHIIIKEIPVPGPTRVVHNVGPTKYVTKNVPGPTKVINHTTVKAIKVPEVIHEPGKTVTRYITKNVPGPVKYITRTRTVQEPTKVVNHNVIKTVKVPGPTQVVHAPGKTITGYINVPGPLRIEKVPGKTITKVVYTPSPTKVIYRTITKNVPGPTQVKYIHIPCKYKIVNHTKIIYVPKVIKEVVTPKSKHKQSIVSHNVPKKTKKIEQRFAKVSGELDDTQKKARIPMTVPKIDSKAAGTHIRKTVDRKYSRSRQDNKLPQTSESSSYASLFAGIMALIGTLAETGYDLNKDK